MCPSVAIAEIEPTELAAGLIQSCDENWGDGCCGHACAGYGMYLDSALGQFASCFDLPCADGCECTTAPFYYGTCIY